MAAAVTLELPQVPTNDPRTPIEERLARLFEWAQKHDIAVRRTLAQLQRSAQMRGRPVQLQAFTVAQVAAGAVRASGAPVAIIVSDEAGGLTLAFSDGTNFRRVQDRAVVS
jgi:cobalamin biosynthesis protein CobT